MHKGSIVDVHGIKVGHFTDPRRPTGCTVVLAPDGTVGGVDVRGAAPGTRETDLLSPLNAVPGVHAVLLSGGSAFGLDAAGGVMRWLELQGVGVEIGVDAQGAQIRVPIVPAAILFDLMVGDSRIRPDADAGFAACVAASNMVSGAAPAEGNVGAGAGATVGKLFGFGRAMRGGIGSASLSAGGFTVGALVAVNAVGDVIDPLSGHVVAGARTRDGSGLHGTARAMVAGDVLTHLQSGAATTIGVIATDARLDKAGATKLAQMAHDGLARCINPVHTQADGDTLFALATGSAGRSANLTLLGTLAAEVMTIAVLRAVRAAVSLNVPGLPHLPAASEFAAPPNPDHKV